MTTSDQTRRRFLLGAGAVASGLALAGCSAAPGDTSPTDAGGGGGEPTDTPTESSDDSGDSGGDGGSWTEVSTVEMTDSLAFEPKRIQVSTGTTVTWENVGAIGHTITAYEDELPDGADYFASGGFDGQQAAVDGYKNGQEGNVPKGESYEYTFETAGTYKYYCIPHEMNGMVGFVKVV